MEQLSGIGTPRVVTSAGETRAERKDGGLLPLLRGPRSRVGPGSRSPRLCLSCPPPLPQRDGRPCHVQVGPRVGGANPSARRGGELAAGSGGAGERTSGCFCGPHLPDALLLIRHSDCGGVTTEESIQKGTNHNVESKIVWYHGHHPFHLLASCDAFACMLPPAGGVTPSLTATGINIQ